MTHLKGHSVFIKPVGWFYKKNFLIEQRKVGEKGRERGNAEIPPRGFTLKSVRTSGFKKELDQVQRNSSCAGYHLLPIMLSGYFELYHNYTLYIIIWNCQILIFFKDRGS